MHGVTTLGACTVASPLRLPPASFVADDAGVRRDIELPERPMAHASDAPETFERAGPRARILFDPRRATVGIVTAGGLCPGLADVVRTIVLELRHGYGVDRVLGFRFGFAGLDPAAGYDPVRLDPEVVGDIHMRGGCILGTSRGPHEARVMVETLVKSGVDALVAIGGDGTMRAAHAIHEEAARRGLRLGVVGVPKSIDNDVPFVDKTFGFDTAVAVARLAIDAAHAEARSVDRGVGLVKLMGRNAGFIAAHATLASHDVNACLVPEVRFTPAALFAWLEKRLAARGHAVIVVAEGCARHVADTRGAARDRSGNLQYTTADADVGRWLEGRMRAHFAARGGPFTLKYIDPSYMLRAVRASSDDAVFCDALARNAVHAAMAGKTDVLVGRWHRAFTHVALPCVLAHDKRLDPGGDVWREVIESTGQPAFAEGAEP
jgi:6-phosphofructokinase 1